MEILDFQLVFLPVVSEAEWLEDKHLYKKKQVQVQIFLFLFLTYQSQGFLGWVYIWEKGS